MAQAKAPSSQMTLNRADYDGHAARASMTPRELAVAALLCQGCSNKAIARDLVLETQTVKSHVSRILAKLGVGNRTAAALVLTEKLGRA